MTNRSSRLRVPLAEASEQGAESSNLIILRRPAIEFQSDLTPSIPTNGTPTTASSVVRQSVNKTDDRLDSKPDQNNILVEHVASLVERMSSLERLVRTLAESTAMPTQNDKKEAPAGPSPVALDLYLAAANQVFERAYIKSVKHIEDDVFQLVLAVRPLPSGTAAVRLKAKNDLLEKVEAKNPQLVGYFVLKFEALDDAS